ncbi:hypothetical protein IST495B_00829 [Burkholderia multivorans]|nr:hypothetical protein IST495B_00829 [Burkholderia multivorans]CAB5305697.1 hypothetical protein IST495A_00218 [Burkholderia multivorans]
MSGLFDQLPPRTSDPSTEPINNAQAGILKAGVRTISHNQQLTFTLYQQYVLPLDGMVYWIRQADTTFTVQGSLHVTNEQLERPHVSEDTRTLLK